MLMFHLLAAFAQFERELIRERVRAGLANARARGKVLGRPRRIVDHEQVRVLRENRVSLRAIAKTAGVSTGVVRRVLALREGEP